MKHLAAREPVYESLNALNHDFECVLFELGRLQELGVFNRDLGNILRVIVQKTRAWANLESVEALRPREQDDLAHFDRLHRRWREKKLEDPYDVIIEAKRLMEKGQKAAGKKGRRKRRDAEDEFERARR
jgi:hypothetical protein